MSRWAIPAGLTWLFVQCDQMAFIVFIIGTLTTMKNCPIVYKIYQSLEQFLPNTKQTLIKLPDILVAKFRQIWSHSILPKMVLAPNFSKSLFLIQDLITEQILDKCNSALLK